MTGRTHDSNPDIPLTRWRAGDLVLDRANQIVLAADSEVQLSPTAFRLLQALMADDQRVHTKDELIETVWGGRAISDAALTTAMKELRKALNDPARSPVFIQTVYGRGYRFIQTVTEEPPLNASLESRDAEPAGPPMPGSGPGAPAQPETQAPPASTIQQQSTATRPRMRPTWIAAAAVSALMLGAVMAIAMFGASGGGLGSRAAQPPLPTVPEDRYSILVAGLENDDANQTYTRSVLEALQFALRTGDEESEVPLETASMPARTEPTVWIERLPRTITVPGQGTRADMRKAEAEARDWLDKTGADIVLWGGVSPEVQTFSIRLTSRQETKFSRYAFEDVRFGTPLLSDVAPLVLGSAVSGATAVHHGEATAPLLRRLEARLRPLAERPPSSMSEEQVRRLRLAYAEIALEYGDLSQGQEIFAFLAGLLEEELNKTTAQTDPVVVARLESALGAAQLYYGEVAADLPSLKEARDHLHSALRVFTRQSTPDDWAKAHKRLGQVAFWIGEREDPEAIARAIEHFEQTLSVWSRDSVPRRWAQTQHLLGTAYASRLAQGQRSAFTKAVAAFQAALQVRRRDTMPMQWAETQGNLGIAYFYHGKDGPTSSIEKAVSSFRAALEVYTAETAPLAWARGHNNLGEALRLLGERGDMQALRDAIAAFTAGLKGWTKDKHPIGWSFLRDNMGATYIAMARQGDTDALDLALRQFEASLQVRTRSSTPTYWAITQARLGEALLLKAEATEDALYARQSLAALDKALALFGDDSQSAVTGEARRHRIAARRLLEEIKAATEMVANDAP